MCSSESRQREGACSVEPVVQAVGLEGHGEEPAGLDVEGRSVDEREAGALGEAGGAHVEVKVLGMGGGGQHGDGEGQHGTRRTREAGFRVHGEECV